MDLKPAKSSPLTYGLPIIAEENQARLGDDSRSAGSRDLQGLSCCCSTIVQQTGAIKGYLLQIDRQKDGETGRQRERASVLIERLSIQPDIYDHSDDYLSVNLRPGTGHFVISSDPVVKSLSSLVPVNLQPKSQIFEEVFSAKHLSDLC